MNALAINEKQIMLEQLIDNAIYNSIVSMKSIRKLQEPDYVAALSTTFSKSFFYILSACFPDYDFSVSSVFCHQKPIVDIGLDKKPELGDILFVYNDINENGEVKFNSLLLQAKVNRSNNFCLKICESDEHQLELYKKWPEFTYHRAGDLNGEKRDIFPKSTNDGAQYLIINESGLKCKRRLICENHLNCEFCREIRIPFMCCAVPDNVLYYNESLSNELINLLKFKSGRTFDESPEDTKDDWSKMIWDLLKILKTACARRKNIHLDRFSRLNCYNHYQTNDMTDKTLLSAFLNKNINIEMSDEENPGVSVILIESQPKEQHTQYEG